MKPLSLRAKPRASTAHALQVAPRAAQITSGSNSETQTIGFAKMIVKAASLRDFRVIIRLTLRVASSLACTDNAYSH